MTTQLAPYLKVHTRALHAPCNRCATAETDANFEINPWWVWYAQQRYENGWPNPVGKYLPGISAQEILPCLGLEFQPPPVGPDLPALPVNSWWYDSARPESVDAFGILVHEFTVEDPMEFTSTQTEILRGRVQLAEGLVLARMVAETTGATPNDARWLGGQVKRHLEGLSPCCPAVATVYTGCGDDVEDKRVLYNAGEFHVRPLDGVEPMSGTGRVFEIVFSAEALAFTDPQPALVTTSAPSLLAQNAPWCLPETETVNVADFTPKTICQADIERQTDGSFLVCPVDYDAGAFDPADCYLDIRRVRAVDPTTVIPCPIQVDLDLTTTPITVNPLQQSLWQSKVLDVIAGGGSIDCVANPVVVRRVTRANNDYRPDCDTCPASIRARTCAEDEAFVITPSGLLDWPASGMDTTTYYTLEAPTNLSETNNAGIFRLMRFLRCMNVFGGGTAVPTQPVWNHKALVTAAEDYITATNLPTIATGVSYRIGTGSMEVNVYNAVTKPDAINEDFTINIPAPFPGYDFSDLITAEGDEGVCGDAPAHCLPTTNGVPTAIGPCVTISIAANGSISSDLDPAVDDLFDARFEFAPCTAVTEEACPGVIPPTASFNVVGQTAQPVGWTGFQGWPLDTEPSRYEVALVGGQANSSNPVQGTRQAERLVMDADCDGPCAPTGLVPRELAESACFEDAPLVSDVQLRTLTGLKPKTSYALTFTLRFTISDQVQVLVGTGPPPTAADMPTICTNESVVSRAILKPDGRTVLSGYSRQLFVVCPDGFVDAHSNGYADPRVPWNSPIVCGATDAWIAIVQPQGAPAVVGFLYALEIGAIV